MAEKESLRGKKPVDRSRESTGAPSAQGKTWDSTLRALARKCVHPRVMGFVSVLVIWQICSMVTAGNALPPPYVVGKNVIYTRIFAHYVYGSHCHALIRFV